MVILNTCVSWCRALTQILKEIYPILDKEKTRDLFRVFTIKLLFKLFINILLRDQIMIGQYI